MTITIPPEALEKAATAIFDASPFRQKEGPLHMQSDAYQALTRAYARAACIAMIENWPGMEYMMGDEAFPFHYIMLPLTENTNA